MQTGKVLTFGTVGTQPKPELCNLHYAICRFVHMAGMADIFNAVEDDDEEKYEDEPAFNAPLDERHRVYGKNILPTRKTKSLLQLMWLALKDKVLVSLRRCL